MRLYNVLANSDVCLSRMSCGVAITGACARLAVNGVHGSSPKMISYGEKLLIRFGDVRYANMAIWMTWSQSVSLLIRVDNIFIIVALVCSTCPLVHGEYGVASWCVIPISRHASLLELEM